jgi:hypothetical protein
MLVMLFGIVTLVRLTQPCNIQAPRLVTLVGIVMLVRHQQYSKPPFPMLIMVLGIVTLVMGDENWLPEHPGSNALSPTLVTGRPLIVLGMVTSPPGPLYPVMVMVPLLEV